MKLLLALFTYELRSSKSIMLMTFLTSIASSLLIISALAPMEQANAMHSQQVSMYSFGFGVGIGGQLQHKEYDFIFKACPYVALIGITAAMSVLMAHYLSILRRERYLQILRSLGIYRNQLFSFLLLEALLISLAGSMMGAFGYVLFSLTVSQPTPRLSVILACLATCLASLLGSFIPSVLATGLLPEDKLRHQPCLLTQRTSTAIGISGSLLLLCVYFISRIPAQNCSFKLQLFSWIGIPLMFLGLAIIMPAFLFTAEKLLCRPIAFLLHIHPLFIKHCISRHPWRTLVVSFTMFFGLSLFVALHTWSTSMLSLFTIPDSVPNALLRVHPCIAVDDMSNAMAQCPLIASNQLTEIAVAQPQLHSHLQQSLRQSGTMGDSAVTIGISPAAFHSLLRIPIHPRNATEQLTLNQRACIIPDSLAFHTGLQCGDVLHMKDSHGSFVAYRIAGTFSFPWLWFTKCTGLRLAASRAAAMIFIPYMSCINDFSAREHEYFWFNEKPNTTDKQMETYINDVVQYLADFHDDGSVAFSGGTRWDSNINERLYQFSTLNKLNASLFSRAYSVIHSMEKLPLKVLLLSGIAILCNLNISILSRNREMHIMHVLGANKNTLMRAITAEAMLIGLCACIFSSLAGIYYAKIANSMLDCAPVFGVLAPQLIIPWTQILKGFAIASVITIILAILTSGLQCRRMVSRHHFSLLELLAVISIFAILASLLLPSLAKGREHARNTACVSLLRQYAQATSMYADENDDIFPDIRNYAQDGFFQYMNCSTPTEKLLRCPADASTENLNRLATISVNGRMLHVSIGGTVNLTDSHSPTSKGPAIFLQSRNDPSLNKMPSLRCQWTDYQNQATSPVVNGAALSIGKGYGASNTSLAEYVFRHFGNSANAAYCDGHVGRIRLHPSIQLTNTGHDIKNTWLFPGNCTWPYGPRQGPPDYPETISSSSVIF